MTEEFWNHPFQVFGFPSKRDEGIWASGVLRDCLANGWVQMEDIKAQGYAVQPGFSGAPVWDEKLQGVVGMAVAAEKKREDAKAAFMIPLAIMAQAWEELQPLIQPIELTPAIADHPMISSLPRPFAIDEVVGSSELSFKVEKLDLLHLTVEQRKDLRATLMAAFPSQPQLELMVEDELGKSLNQITQGQPNYELVVRDLVKWAESNGQVRSLLEGSVRANPGNPKLQELAKLWLK